MRRIVSSIALSLALGAVGCSTGDSMFPRTGTLRPQLLDLTLASQTSPEPSNQFMSWVVVKAEADVPGVGTVNLLTKEDTDAACLQVQQIVLVNQVLKATCRVELTGLALEAGTTGTATVRLEVKDVWVTRADLPVPDPDGDTDGDGIDDVDDNCPYIANPEQENENEEEEGEHPVGDACTNANGAKDSDADGVADLVDNCVYVANPAPQTASTTGDPPYAVVDTVGVECATKIRATPLGSTVLIRRTDLPFTIRDGGTTVIRFDFRSKDWCPNDPLQTSCTLTADDVTVSIQ
ncbi:MAG TPA: thrombospondin type 3 repeat-containing protein [Candidatus Polarisedimenticolaceae bacterium]|nr:thrombospondin type 3 repeat-containing protein [Candidatus Polarisedimenticolaceae bacterium]